MIGSGVFVTSGFSLGDLRSPALVVLAWIVAGCIAIAGALSYGKLIRLMPESGGEYLFLSRAFHPMFGFIAGWVSMFAGFSAAIAIAALAFEEYALQIELVADFKLLPGVIAVSAVVLAALLHGIKVKLGAAAQNIAVGSKIFLLLAFLAYAAFKLEPSAIKNELEPISGLPLATAFCTQLMWIALSYMGFNAAVYIADEVEDAESRIPNALLLGTTIVVILYVSLNFVFVYSTDSANLAGQKVVAGIAAQSLGGAAFKSLFIAIILVALFTSVTSMMMAAPRVYAKMADEGMLPGIFRFQNETPIYSIVLQTVLACVIVFMTDLKNLLGYLGVTLSLCAAASVSTLFLPRFWRGQSPYFLIAPLFYVVATLLAVFMTVWYNPFTGGEKSVYAAFITFGVGVVLYLFRTMLLGGTETAVDKKNS